MKQSQMKINKYLKGVEDVTQVRSISKISNDS